MVATIGHSCHDFFALRVVLLTLQYLDDIATNYLMVPTTSSFCNKKISLYEVVASVAKKINILPPFFIVAILR